MQIVIEIPEGTKRAIDMGTINQVLTYKVWDAIKNGTPLPEHHERLLILDERLVEHNLVSLNTTTSFCNKWLSEVGISNSVVKIIPATKEGE